MLSGPNRMADTIRDRLDDLGAELEECSERKERSRINKEMHRLKDLLRWCETRAGYNPN